MEDPPLHPKWHPAPQKPHQQNDRLAVVLGVYFGPSIVVRNPLWCWVTVAILWNAGVLWYCGARVGVYLFLPFGNYRCQSLWT